MNSIKNNKKIHQLSVLIIQNNNIKITNTPILCTRYKMTIQKIINTPILWPQNNKSITSKIIKTLFYVHTLSGTTSEAKIA